ncbi:electron transfer flavoprotein subunit alpha/FixB family protein, partial [Streptomyces anulatus]|uniref:electron transfer flavoprotein subunit alpha/FixB family protein n=1 Tax=Streptomyces anulatus TaxID=1892 RepID=UPI003571102C
MAEVLVLVDHVDGAVRKPTLELLTLARRVGDPVAVVLGAGAGDTAPVLGEHGAVKVLTADAPEFADYLVVPKVDALQAAFEAVSPVAVLVVSSAEGKEIAARLALRVGSGIITDATDLEAGDQGVVATQAAFAASFTTKSRVSRGVPVITVKPNSAPVEPAPAAGAVEALPVSFGETATGTKVTS